MRMCTGGQGTAPWTGQQSSTSQLMCCLLMVAVGGEWSRMGLITMASMCVISPIQQQVRPILTIRYSFYMLTVSINDKQIQYPNIEVSHSLAIAVQS